jgi:hypothetical protein
MSKTLPNASWDLIKSTLSVILGIGILRRVNKILCQASLNHYSCDLYDWRKEIVVVTGGTGGIGDVLVRKLAKHNVKVISLDIVPPNKPLRVLCSP